MKVYKSTRIKNYFEKPENGAYVYERMDKIEDGTYNAVFHDKDGRLHCFNCDFSDKTIIILSHTIGKLTFVATETTDEKEHFIRA